MYGFNNPVDQHGVGILDFYNKYTKLTFDLNTSYPMYKISPQEFVEHVKDQLATMTANYAEDLFGDGPSVDGLQSIAVTNLSIKLFKIK